MAMISKENDTAHQIPPVNAGLDEIVISWLLKRFKELPKESFNDIVSLLVMFTDQETEKEARVEIYETIREILFPQLIGNVRLGNLGQAEEIPNKLEKRTSWIGNKVKEIREDKGLTQSDLAEKSGLRQPQISRLEAGVHSPSYKTLEKIAKALSIDIGDLDPSHSQ